MTALASTATKVVAVVIAVENRDFFRHPLIFSKAVSILNEELFK